MSGHPDPEQLARLQAHSVATGAGSGVLAPFAQPLAFHDGFALVPAPDAGSRSLWVHSGVHLAWQAVPEMAGAILVQFGGRREEAERAGDGLAYFVTQAGLERLITDLQSIVLQIGASE